MMKFWKMLKRKPNDCAKCPYHHQESDYWGEWDEWCDCKSSEDFIKDDCFLPLIIRHLFKLRQSYRIWKWDRQAFKKLREEEKIRIKLNMTEEEYWEHTHGGEKIE